jgi:acetamidase/formamidase
MSATRTHHWLRASRDTVITGIVDGSLAPVLTVESGDEVSIETWNAWGNAVDETLTIDDVMRYIAASEGRGPHDLTGPIEVRGASPGDVLQVDMLELRISDRGFNLNLPIEMHAGILPERYPHGGVRHYRIDRERDEVELATGVRVRLAPFLGVIAVAPPDDGWRSSLLPGPYGGNLDLKELVAGSTIYFPVFAPGALLCIGDAHAAQGDGELNVTALETSVEEARLRLTLLEGPAHDMPCAETATHWITLGIGDTLDAAAAAAAERMLDFLVGLGIDEDDAYAIGSIAVDLSVTQVVNHIVGVHAKLPKAAIRERDGVRETFVRRSGQILDSSDT